MIITNIRLQEKRPMTGASGTWPLPVCDLSLDSSAGANGYTLKTALGLGPPDLTEIVEGFDAFGTPVIIDVPEKRDIVLRIALTPTIGQTYSTLRDNLYKLISRTVLVNLMNDALVIAQVTGHIHKFEVVHFTDQPEVQMTIECQEGDFAAPESIDIALSYLNSLTPVINYEEGTAPAGIEFQFRYTAVGTGTGFLISNHAQGHLLGNVTLHNEFRLTFPFITNDVITVCTQPKDKRITLLRSGVTSDLAGYVNAGAVWPQLHPGVNTFDWTFASSWMTWISASYIPKYWGV